MGGLAQSGWITQHAESMEDVRKFAPAAARNRDPILSVLREVLPAKGTVLEVASGTGEHVVHFAQALPGLVWQPSDPSAEARASIAAWSAHHELSNVLPPLALDAGSPDWPVDRVEAMVCINMIHISPWEACLGLMAGARRVLDSGAPLVLYGPFRRPGRPLEASNAAFDVDLRLRDPRWGLRDLADVEAAAAGQGLRLERAVDMPANNLTVAFRRT